MKILLLTSSLFFKYQADYAYTVGDTLFNFTYAYKEAECKLNENCYRYCTHTMEFIHLKDEPMCQEWLSNPKEYSEAKKLHAIINKDLFGGR